MTYGWYWRILIYFDNATDDANNVDVDLRGWNVTERKNMINCTRSSFFLNNNEMTAVVVASTTLVKVITAWKARLRINCVLQTNHLVS